MEKIEWSDEFSVGVPELDNQHQLILSEINKLIELKGLNRESSEIGTVVSNIISYATKHLSYEEDLLIDNDYPDYEQHFAKHNAYRNDFYSKLSSSSSSIDEILVFLLHWWNDHILEEDMKYKSFFAQKSADNA